METLNSTIDQLHVEIQQCEGRLQHLKSLLHDANLKKLAVGEADLDTNVPLDGIGSQIRERPQPMQYNRPMSNAEYKRYGRQLIMPEVGLKGQLRLRSGRVLIVGAGGLGCPAAAYLAGAGVGKLGLVDGDTVEESNLHRQILHSTSKVGMKKIDSAIAYLTELNPLVEYAAHREHLRADTALEIFDGYDVVLDCTDNPASRYLVSDACVISGKTLISASALKTDGQLMMFNYPPRPAGDVEGGPCYRCMFPKPPPPDSVVTCGEGGILGPVVGVMGVLQALEAIKVITNGISETPQALLFSAYSSTPFRSFRMCRRRKTCVSCSPNATVTAEALKSGSLDYIQFCGARSSANLLAPEERIAASDLALVKESIVIDMREAVEYELCNLPGSRNFPFGQLVDWQQSGHPYPDDSKLETLIRSIEDEVQDGKELVAICRRGNDSQVAVRFLKKRLNNYTIRDIKGGLDSYRQDVDPTFPDY